MKEKDSSKSSRRKFLKNFGAGVGAASIAGAGLLAGQNAKASSGKKLKLLSSDGKLVEVDADAVTQTSADTKEESNALRKRARVGLPNRKFTMVVDLAKCGNARKCVDACQHGHMLPKSHEWIKLYYLQDSEHTAPYWFPKTCYHCDNPLCVSVCPVGATYKRDDGIVLVDTKRCIGCKFCMTGCPYSARQFHWGDPEVEVAEDFVYDPELNNPPVEGTTGKCIFCADRLRKNQLPRCVSACPMGALYFGDIIEDAITNGQETVRFSDIMRDKHGYRYMEELGTHPSVYYLPATDRSFTVESGLEGLDEEVKNRYKDAEPRGKITKK